MVFRGIPYAAPPVGDLRWRAAQPHGGWGEIFDARVNGLTAPQPWRPGGDPIMGGHGNPPFGEDCLTLNIWTPGADSAGRPVLVWIHGGGFMTGSANLENYSGAEFARDGDIVVVGINYRLGAFGFLHGLGDSNLWLSDQAAALQWIADNIAAFGGDSDRITVAGQSGGGFGTAALSAHPEARQCFQRAIVMSPPLGLSLPTPEEAFERTHALASALGHDDVDALRGETWERLIEGSLAVVGRNAEFGEWNLAFLPVLDPETMPQHPLQSLIDSDVDLIIGWTHDEAAFRFGLDPVAAEATNEQVVEWAAKRHGDRAPELTAAYRAAHPGARPVDVLTDLLSDDLFRMPSIRVAEERAASVAVRTYQFDLTSRAYDGVLGSPHCFELPFAFGNLSAWSHAPFLEGIDDFVADRVSGALHRALIAFIRDDSPGFDGLPGWPTYTVPERATMVFDDESRLELDPVGVWREAQSRSDYAV
jgi:carboxylesterase type B